MSTSQSSTILLGSKGDSPFSKGTADGTMQERGNHDYNNKKEEEHIRKRKRIQQACRSCGVKRVKCNGLKPCATCIKSGETCEYGQPKKRGPPKGSTRGGSKAAAKRAAQLNSLGMPGRSAQYDAEHIETQPTTPWHFDRHAPEDPRFAPSQVGIGPLRQLHPASEAPADGRDFRPPILPRPLLRYGPDHDREMRGRFEILSETFGAGRSSMSTSSVGGDSASSPQSCSTTGSRKPPETIFHGTTSGLGILRAQGGDRRLPPLFFGSSSGQSGPSHALDRESKMELAREMARSFRSPHWGAASDHIQHGCRYSGPGSPVVHRDAMLAHRPEPSEPMRGMLPPGQSREFLREGLNPRLRMHLDRGHFNQAEALGTPAEAVPEIDLEPLLWESPESAAKLPSRGGITLTKPEIPKAVVEKLFTIIWGVLQTSWPLLYKPALPLIGHCDIIDEEKRPLLYNTVAALASLGWFDGNISDSQAETAKTQSEQDERKIGKASAHSLTYLSGATRPLTTIELSSIFFVRAKYHLINTFDEPSLEAVQSQLILALREQGLGHPAQAAVYMNAACRMAIDLGLHRNCDFSATLGIRFTHAEEQERRRAFWMCYILDKATSASLGRPTSLRDVEADCPLPSRDEPDEYEIWADIADSTSLIRNEARSTLLRTPLRAMSHFLVVLRLGQISEQILALYNVVREKQPPQMRKESWETKLFSLHQQLEDLQHNLGPDLKIEEPRNRLPNRLCLSMWLAVNKLILHRPHILKVPTAEGMPSSHQVCWHEVGRICQIIEMYRDNFGLRKLSQTFVYAIFTSATIEIANTTSMDPAVASEAKRRLKMLMGCLPPISGTWPSASQHLEILKRLARGIDADVDGTGIDSQPSEASRSVAAKQFGPPIGEIGGGGGGGGQASWRKPSEHRFSLSYPSSAVASPSWQQRSGEQPQDGPWQAVPSERRGNSSSLSAAMNVFDTIPGPLGAPMDFSRSRTSLLGQNWNSAADDTQTYQLSQNGGSNGQHGDGARSDALYVTGGSNSSNLGDGNATAEPAAPISGPGANYPSAIAGAVAAAPLANTNTNATNASYGWAPPSDGTRNGAGQGDLGSVVPQLQAPGLVSGITPTGGGFGLPAAGTANVNPNLDADALLRFHDASYWGSMPLSSEDALSWANFTNSYVEALASVLGPGAAVAANGEAVPSQQQQQGLSNQILHVGSGAEAAMGSQHGQVAPMGMASSGLGPGVSLQYPHPLGS